uniref:Large ribosomal subunit protein uL24c n=1 Tax=Izziella formosana TaxID=1653389 RepID=A0A1G4NUU8_9FLOR|nr:Ribosomal protein L24 [Izziella formosana]SCW22417.1 Ribosomal protein L24 [Izziella formosana]
MTKNKNSKPKLHVKIGDMVKIISGDYKGQIGEVIKTFPKKQQIIVRNINMKTKHIRPTQEGQSGQILKKEAPLASSNAMLYDQETETASRYRKQKISEKAYKRILIKSI